MIEAERPARHFVASRGVLGLSTNFKRLRWTFGHRMPERGADEVQACAVKLQLWQEPSAFFSGSAGAGKPEGRYGHARGRHGQGSIRYQRRLFPGVRLRCQVEDALGPQPIVRTNRAYRRLVHFRFMNLASVGFVLADLASLLLLRRGLVPLHCAGFRSGTAAFAVFGPAGTGKTTLLTRACLERGADLLSEDVTISDGRLLYGVPWTQTLRGSPPGLSLPASVRARLALRSKLPLLELFLGRRAAPLAERLPAERVLDRVAATHLVILEQGPEDVRAESPAAAFQKIVNLNRSVFAYQRSLVNNALEFFNPELSLLAAAQTESETICRLVNQVEGCLTVSAERPGGHLELLLKAVA